MISIFLCVVVTTLKWLEFYITPTLYILISLPCTTSSILSLRLFIVWIRHKYRKFSRTTVWIGLFCFKYLISFILLVFLFRHSDSIYEIWYLFQIHFTKNKPLYNHPQLLWQCKCCNCYHGCKLAANHSIVCYYIMCFLIHPLWSRCLFIESVVLFAIIVSAVIVVRNHLLGMD